MYIGRNLWYNEFVPICAMEVDRLSGGVPPLIINLGHRWMWALLVISIHETVGLWRMDFDQS